MDDDARTDPDAREYSALITLPMIAIGLGVIACCFIIPAADANRRLAYEGLQLQADHDHLQQQIRVNEEFLGGLGGDPALLERLAQRQMNLVRQGTAVLEVPGGATAGTMSPYELLLVPPPPELPPYVPYGGRFSALVREPRTRLFMIGGALLLVAAGLVLGSGPTRA